MKLKCGFHGTVRGYFDSVKTAVEGIESLDDMGEEGTYITLNPVNPALLARTDNEFEERAATRAADQDVSRRLWLPIDVDPVRPAGISSTEEELAAAIDRRLDVMAYLIDLGLPEPVLIMSGNGAHALFAIDEPNDADTAALVRNILVALDAKFSDDKVKVDTTVHNAARIWTIPGSLKRKGRDMADRPHRVATIDSLPSLDVVSRERLEAIAPVSAPKRGRPKKSSLPIKRKSGGILDMQAEFSERGLYLRELAPGKHAVTCPWAEGHSGQSGITETVIYEPADEGEVWGFKCQHHHCSEHTIKEVWELFRPDEEAPDPEDAAIERVSIKDFVYVAPQDRFLCLPTGDLWLATAVNNRFKLKPRASDQIALANTVEQMTWLPGQPAIVENIIVSGGGFAFREGYRAANQYRAPERKGGNPDDIELWLEHLVRLYPDTFEHIVDWFSHRVQFPGEKINHALVLGGKQGIGKDTILDPLKSAVGASNFAEISPKELIDTYTPHLQSVVLRVSESRDLGDENRYAFYEASKTVITAPPDVLRVNDKYVKAYYVPNVTGVIFTTNHRNGLYLPEDDRRHHVSWAEDVSKESFNREYWDGIYQWYAAGGRENVVAHLAARDISNFDAKNPPPKTNAWRGMVAVGMDPIESDLSELLDRAGRPPVLSIQELKASAGNEEIFKFLVNKSNRRRVPHLMEGAGYKPVRSTFAKDGLWVVGGKRVALYALESMLEAERIRAVRAYVEKIES